MKYMPIQFDGPYYWYQTRAIQFSFCGGRRPASVREWLHCFYNVDVFYGPVPFLKCVALISWAIAYSC